MKSLVRRAFGRVRQRLIGTVTHFSTEEPLVALTFDDGPDPLVTPALLEILATHQVKATFFMTGENAGRHPDVVKAVRDGGHAIGNHSWDHPSFPLVSGRERRDQIRRCAELLAVSGPALFRPPYGHQSLASWMDTRLSGHEVVAWNVGVPDWEDHDGAWLADFALQRISAGSVVLMHDGMVDFQGDHDADHSRTLDAVARILSDLHGRFEFVTVPDLMRRGRAVRTEWWLEPDLKILNSLSRRCGPPRRYESPEDSV